MARKPDIQYIHLFYVPGSEAQVLAPKPQRKKKKKFVLPKARQEKKIRIAVDAASVCGLVVASMMLVLMIVGVCQLAATCEDYVAMESYVIGLQNENVSLKEEYKSGYDLDDVREKALAIGMVPIEEVETITIKAAVPAEEPDPTWWENICWYSQELFA